MACVNELVGNVRGCSKSRLVRWAIVYRSSVGAKQEWCLVADLFRLISDGPTV